VGDGQFTAELDQALVNGTIDIAVHSLKDLPTLVAPGLCTAAILPRGDARDALLSRHPGGLHELPFGARVGTGSPRRGAQLAAVRSDLVARAIRGNVDTRMRRLEAGEYDAIVLAVAGLERLGIDVSPEQVLPPEVMLPAPGQGAIALQVRAQDGSLIRRLARVDHEPTRVAVEAERNLLRAVGGGCLAPLGALGEVQDGRLRLRAVYETKDGMVTADVAGPVDRSAALVAEAAVCLLEATQ
ncbi:MAG TPA: hydroxymethylbilane synthase, partial [Candidatus Limnocylindria bacterium]|nr:hydroxymethylbilane synthase [Candidatus Limnocylindria bacterium]